MIVGAEILMFLGSMIMGPLGGLVIKYVDKALEKRIPAGFEMVINNFIRYRGCSFVCWVLKLSARRC